MKPIYVKLKKILLWSAIAVAVCIVLVLSLLSPIAKYLVEKYDVKYTGRNIEVGWILLNPFTGYIKINDLKIYEQGNPQRQVGTDSLFFSSKTVKARFRLLKMLSGNIEIKNLELDQPEGIIIQHDSLFNFDDIVRKFTPEKSADTGSSTHFSINGIKITNGKFHYREELIPINYYIVNTDIESSGIFWNSDSLVFSFSFGNGSGKGKAKGVFSINYSNLDYRLSTVISNLELGFLEQNLKQMANYGHFTANLNANIKASGNFGDYENLEAKGSLELTDFHIGKNVKNDYASFANLSIQIQDLSPKKHLYLFDTILLIKPYLKYERYDFLDNLQMMFGQDGANITESVNNQTRFNLVLTIAEYIKSLSKNFFQKHYEINKLEVRQGCLDFADYSLSEKFSIRIQPFNFRADSINRNNKWVRMTASTGIQPFGKIKVNLILNPKDSSDFEFHYQLNGVPLALFNPYVITYTSFPIDRGTMEINGNWIVRNSKISSNNHLILIDPRLSKRIRKEDANWVPLPLIMAFVKERGNVIDYEIPITGNLKDPKFHLSDVLFDLLGNIFTKPATTPYRMQVRTLENEIEKSLTLKWSMRQWKMLPKQERFLRKMAKFIEANPAASIDVYPVSYITKEKEHILLFEARRMYLLSIAGKRKGPLSQADSIKAERFSVKDSLFLDYLNTIKGNKQNYTVQEKCRVLVGDKRINELYTLLLIKRKQEFMNIFSSKDASSRLRFHPTENSIPFNGYSYFKINFKGELPAALRRAYLQMNELNNESPRKRFRLFREKNKIQSQRPVQCVNNARNI